MKACRRSRGESLRCELWSELGTWGSWFRHVYFASSSSCPGDDTKFPFIPPNDKKRGPVLKKLQKYDKEEAAGERGCGSTSGPWSWNARDGSTAAAFGPLSSLRKISVSGDSSSSSNGNGSGSWNVSTRWTSPSVPSSGAGDVLTEDQGGK